MPYTALAPSIICSQYMLCFYRFSEASAVGHCWVDELTVQLFHVRHVRLGTETQGTFKEQL